MKNKLLAGLTLAAAMFTLAAHAQSVATITIQASQPGVVISSNLFGIFFEEINSAGEGGIYAELVRNRSFEDSSNSLPNWSLVTSGSAAGQIALNTSQPMSATNTQSLALTMSGGSGSVGAANTGWFGIPVTNSAAYNLEFYARGAAGFSGNILVSLESTNGSAVYAQNTFNGLTTSWQHFTATLTANATDANARLVVRILQAGTVYVDFVSLFPAATFHNRTNGLRPDLANMLVNLNPSFMRFPGGSWVDGTSIANAYHWQPTAGFLPDRVERANIWGYMVSNGLGYYEYLQMCEDLGTQPLFDVNCGMDVSQNSVGVANLGPWVQEALDAIQYANGDTNTVMGAQRAAAGHPAPFNLQYIEIGNENNGSAYNANYGVFYNAIKSNYPAMHIIANSFGTVPSSAPVEIVDEHYYNSAAWFAQNSTKYDSYSRTGPKVFVGEYAVAYNIGPGFLATLQNALGEAAWMTGLERNADIVTMACYAPLFCNLNNQDWTPDLIYFNGTQVYGTPSYYVQQMFSQNRGDVVLPTTTTITNSAVNAVLSHGAIGVGAWNTSVQYTNIVVTSNGVILYQSDFVNQGTNGWRVYNGTWSVGGGLYQQTSTTTTDCRTTTGSTNWANYTISLRARKTGGSEGFLVMFNWLDDNNWTWWNVGGWVNTYDGVEQMVNGTKTLITSQVPQNIQNNTWYDISIQVTNNTMLCYLNGSLIQTATNPAVSAALYTSSSYVRASGEIIVKSVNPSSVPVTTTFNFPGVNAIAPNATLIQLTSGSPGDLNSMAAPTYVFPVTNAIVNASTNFTITLPANSFSVLCLQASGINSITNLLLQVPSPLNTGQQVAATVFGQQAGPGSLINLSDNASYGITYASLNPSIAAVDGSGNVTGIGSGTTSIIATYAALGISATQAVQVISVPTTLVHRYSFNETSGSTVNDSIGGAAWNGTLPKGGTFAGGKLSLAASGSQYVQLPSGILSNYTMVTIEAWVTFPDQLPANCFFFGFGNISGASGANYIFCAPQAGRVAITGTNPGYTGEQNAYSAVDFSYHTNFHVTAVFNPPAGYVALYTNGVLAGINNSVTTSFNSVNDVYSYIGKSLYSPDPYPDFTLDEFRIYNGALQSAEIAATDALGPNQLLNTASPNFNAPVLSANKLSLSWPLASAGFTLMSRTDLTFGDWTPVSSPAPQIVGSQWQITLPVNGGTQFYRLQR
jgi:alpha-L-arabinofuranosidase